MDLLYSSEVSYQAFVIVSSDSDFTRLAMRLRYVNAHAYVTLLIPSFLEGVPAKKSMSSEMIAPHVDSELLARCS